MILQAIGAFAGIFIGIFTAIFIFVVRKSLSLFLEKFEIITKNNVEAAQKNVKATEELTKELKETKNEIQEIKKDIIEIRSKVNHHDEYKDWISNVEKKIDGHIEKHPGKNLGGIK